LLYCLAYTTRTRIPAAASMMTRLRCADPMPPERSKKASWFASTRTSPIRLLRAHRFISTISLGELASKEPRRCYKRARNAPTAFEPDSASADINTAARTAETSGGVAFRAITGGGTWLKSHASPIKSATIPAHHPRTCTLVQSDSRAKNLSMVGRLDLIFACRVTFGALNSLMFLRAGFRRSMCA